MLAKCSSDQYKVNLFSIYIIIKSPEDKDTKFFMAELQSCNITKHVPSEMYISGSIAFISTVKLFNLKEQKRMKYVLFIFYSLQTVSDLHSGVV